MNQPFIYQYTNDDIELWDKLLPQSFSLAVCKQYPEEPFEGLINLVAEMFLKNRIRIKDIELQKHKNNYYLDEKELLEITNNNIFIILKHFYDKGLPIFDALDNLEKPVEESKVFGYQYIGKLAQNYKSYFYSLVMQDCVHIINEEQFIQYTELFFKDVETHNFLKSAEFHAIGFFNFLKVAEKSQKNLRRAFDFLYNIVDDTPLSLETQKLIFEILEKTSFEALANKFCPDIVDLGFIKTESSYLTEIEFNFNKMKYKYDIINSSRENFTEVLSQVSTLFNKNNIFNSLYPDYNIKGCYISPENDTCILFKFENQEKSDFLIPILQEIICNYTIDKLNDKITYNNDENKEFLSNLLMEYTLENSLSQNSHKKPKKKI